MIAALPVRVTAMTEHPDADREFSRALVVQAGPAVLGVAARTARGWTTGVRAGLFRRRILYADHPTPQAAVTAIMGSPVGRRLVSGFSPVHWSAAADQSARDPQGVTA